MLILIFINHRGVKKSLHLTRFWLFDQVGALRREDGRTSAVLSPFLWLEPRWAGGELMIFGICDDLWYLWWWWLWWWFDNPLRWWCWWFRTGFLCSIGRSRTWWGSSLISSSSSSCLALPSSPSSPSPSPTKVGALPCRYNVLSCNVLSEGLPAYPKSVSSSSPLSSIIIQ